LIHLLVGNVNKSIRKTNPRERKRLKSTVSLPKENKWLKRPREWPRLERLPLVRKRFNIGKDMNKLIEKYLGETITIRLDLDPMKKKLQKMPKKKAHREIFKWILNRKIASYEDYEELYDLVERS